MHILNHETVFIDGKWQTGEGASFVSENPANKAVLLQLNQVSEVQVEHAISAAKKAFYNWSLLALADRIAYVQAYCDLLSTEKDNLAKLIAQETGKPHWEAKTEVTAMINKIAISIDAYNKRTGHHQFMLGSTKAIISHKPYGVFAVLGPYNFPGHLPNGHIVPALIAGNTIVFKPSELTPAVAIFMVKLWQKAQLPDGVLNLIHGDGQIGKNLIEHASIDGVLFTGSASTGKKIHRYFADHPGKLLALEMGGNNPLIVHQPTHLKAAVHDTIQSAFITTGQRCTCARRLLIPDNQWGDEFLTHLVQVSSTLRIGSWDEDPEPFFGPLISNQAALHIKATQDQLLKGGAESLLFARGESNSAFLTPGILDVTACLETLPDEEYFGPLLQVIRYQNLEQAIDIANNTRYGLACGFFGDQLKDYQLVNHFVKAGIINWNKPTTGASSQAPFGGLGDSGNLRPSAYYAADYCAYPVASLESETLEIPEKLSPGLILDN